MGIGLNIVLLFPFDLSPLSLCLFPLRTLIPSMYLRAGCNLNFYILLSVSEFISSSSFPSFYFSSSSSVPKSLWPSLSLQHYPTLFLSPSPSISHFCFSLLFLLSFFLSLFFLSHHLSVYIFNVFMCVSLYIYISLSLSLSFPFFFSISL